MRARGAVRGMTRHVFGVLVIIAEHLSLDFVLAVRVEGEVEGTHVCGISPFLIF